MWGMTHKTCHMLQKLFHMWGTTHEKSITYHSGGVFDEISDRIILKDTATRCNTRKKSPYHSEGHCSTLQHAATLEISDRIILKGSLNKSWLILHMKRDWIAITDETERWTVLQFVAVCCSALQRVALRCSVLQCIAMCCCALQCAAACCSALQYIVACCTLRHCIISLNGTCARALQCVAMCWNMAHKP